MPTRRKLLKLGVIAPIANALAASGNPAAPSVTPACKEVVSLNGDWSFRLDPRNSGEAQGWHQPAEPADGWRTVSVPHTWQIEPAHTDYMGVGWYRRTFAAPTAWSDRAVRVEFEAVFHTATVWLNGVEVGRHIGKGYTAFVCDLSPRLRLGEANTLVVRADNTFSESMLPRGRSSDWAHDGGIYRLVRLLVTPKAFIETVAVDADPDLGANQASLQVTAGIRNANSAAWHGQVAFQVFDEASGELVALESAAVPAQLGAGQGSTLKLRA